MLSLCGTLYELSANIKISLLVLVKTDLISSLLVQTYGVFSYVL